MRDLWQWLTTDRIGVLIVLAIAAWLEARGDFLWNQCLNGAGPVVGILGSVALVAYGVFLNSAKLPFAALIGVYIVFFFAWAQIFAYRETRALPPANVIAGGILIVVGGLVIHCWKPS